MHAVVNFIMRLVGEVLVIAPHVFGLPIVNWIDVVETVCHLSGELRLAVHFLFA